MKLIDISTKKHPNVFVMVDDADYADLSQWKWSAEKRRSGFYAIRGIRRSDGSKSTIRMHTQILRSDDGAEIDHRDGNGLNNQRSNLRTATEAQNQWNTRKTRGKTSRFKGVSWCARFGRWKAFISVNGCHINLGSYSIEEAAAVAYNEAAKAMHGQFAQINEGLCLSAIEAAQNRLSSPRWKNHSPRFLWPAVDDLSAANAVEALLADFGA